MNTANSITCTSVIDPPSYADLVRNWATTVTCEVPEPGTPWITIWQAIAAFATLVAVGVAVWQAISANKQAQEAREDRDKSEQDLYRREKDDRYRSASRLSAWVAISDGVPVLHLVNGSSDPMYDVVVCHDGLLLGRQSYDILPPGFEHSESLPRFYVTGEKQGKPVLPGLVRIRMTDPLGHEFERDPENKGVISELGPCH